MGGAEDCVGIFCRLQDFFVHSPVAGVVSTLATRRRDNDLAIGLPVLGIEMDSAAFQSEGSVHQM